MFELGAPSEVQSCAQAAVHWAKARFEITLDFSEESLQEVEKILGRLRHQFPKHSWTKALRHSRYQQEISEIALVWGSYVGEVIRKNYGGEWDLGSNSCGSKTISLQMQETKLFPIEEIYQRLIQRTATIDDLRKSISKHLTNSSSKTSVTLEGRVKKVSFGNPFPNLDGTTVPAQVVESPK